LIVGGWRVAAALAVLLRTLLFGITLAAPGIYAASAAALALVALAACVIPAQRAARVTRSGFAQRINQKELGIAACTI